MRVKIARHPGEARGVTAVELLTLVLLLIILAAFAIPSMSPVVLRQRLSGAAWQLAGDLRLARQRAVTVRKRFRVCLTNCAIAVSAGSYSIERDDGTVASPNWISETGVSVRLPSDVAITTTATATFATNGMASGGTFRVSNIMGTYQIAVASTGRVKVCRETCSP